MSHKKVPESLRKIVVKRAREQCEYCRTIIQASPQRFQMEYIQPYSKGGKAELVLEKAIFRKPLKPPQISFSILSFVFLISKKQKS